MEDAPDLHDEGEWPYVRTLLPRDLEDSARQFAALVRCRNVPSAEALLRMALAYAVSDLSLKDVAAWAGALQVAELTGPGLFYRLREAERWLEHVLAQTLQLDLPAGPVGRPLRVVDATVINGPGATGTQWRAHMVLEPATGRFRAVELTDAHGGEGLARHRWTANEIALGDCAYATARGIHATRQAGAHVVARLNPAAIRLCGLDRQRWNVATVAATIPAIGPVEHLVLLPVPPEPTPGRERKGGWSLRNAIAWIEVRLVAARTRTGEVIWIITTLPADQMSAVQILEVYRLRWQVELLFKRLKSLLHLDMLPSRQGPTARSWMLARLLAAALAQRLVQPEGPLSPWGYELFAECFHP